MKINYQKLIDSFYDGTITDSEEIFLENYFKSDSIEPRHLKDRKIFLALHQHPYISVPDNLESDIDTIINNISSAEKTVLCKTVKTHRLNTQWLYKVAAILVFSAFIGISAYHSHIEQKSKMSQQLAYENVTNALLLVSKKLNEGDMQMKKADESFSKINNTLNKVMIHSNNE